MRNKLEHSYHDIASSDVCYENKQLWCDICYQDIICTCICFIFDCE